MQTDSNRKYSSLAETDTTTQESDDEGDEFYDLFRKTLES